MVETKTTTPQQISCIKTLITKLKIEDKDALVMGFTSMRTASVKEMTLQEGVALIKHLKGQDPDERSAELMRAKLIAMAYKRAGLSRTASKEQKQAVVNWLNGWCKTYGYLKKGMNSYTQSQLPKLVSQFEIVIDKLVIEL